MKKAKANILIALIILPSAILNAKVNLDVVKVDKPDTSKSIDVGNIEGINNEITVGDIITSEKQLLYQKMPIPVDFSMGIPLEKAIATLSEISGISWYMNMSDIGTTSSEENEQQDEKIYMKGVVNTFKALETIVLQQGLQLKKENEIWVIGKADPTEIYQKVYNLKNVHLGFGGASAGEESFGRGFEGTSGNGGDSDTNNNTNNNTNNSSSNNTNTNTNNSNNNSQANNTGQNTTGTLGSTQVDFSDIKGQNILVTIRELINMANLSSDEEENQDDDAGATNDTKRLVSYDADTNSIYVVANEKEHEWVSDYLEHVDAPMTDIAINALFVESTKQPQTQMGVDWSETAVDWNVGTSSSEDSSSGLALGSLDSLSFPGGSLLSSDGLQAKISSFINNTNSRIATFPRVVTANNREVKIETTTNIPVIQNVSTSSLGGNTGATSGEIGQTDFSTSTQQVGTIIRLIPRLINEEEILLTVVIEISTVSNDSSGENITGRVPTTSTQYEGTVVVPRGKTLAIGGLQRIARTANSSKIPVLGDIPLFGFAFRKEDMKDLTTNISLFITPQVLDKNKPSKIMKNRKSNNNSIDDAYQDSQDAYDEADDHYERTKNNEIFSEGSGKERNNKYNRNNRNKRDKKEDSQSFRNRPRRHRHTR